MRIILQIGQNQRTACIIVKREIQDLPTLFVRHGNLQAQGTARMQTKVQATAAYDALIMPGSKKVYTNQPLADLIGPTTTDDCAVFGS